MKKHVGSGDANLFRRRAEDHARTKPLHAVDFDSLSQEEKQRVFYELQVHQIELEMLNESLLETQSALEESHARYSDLFEFAPISYLSLTGKGLIVDINQSGAALLGETRGKLQKVPFARFVLPEDADRWHLYLVKLLGQNEKLECELQLRRSDGGRMDAHVDGVRQTRDGQAAAVRIALTDVTKAKHLEQALVEKNSELRRTMIAAEKANLAKSEFLSGMSHELRSPLNAILGFAQLLEAGKTPPSADQTLQIREIIKAGWYLLDLINKILDLSAIESGKVPLSLEPVSLVEVLGECRAMVEDQARTHGIRLAMLPFDDTWFVKADRTRLKQVLLNLLSNAIKYNRDQGTVEVSCTASGPGSIRLSVKDSGLGLAPDKLSQLFQPFNRLGQELGGEEGTGIGLVVTKRLVERMGGVIDVESMVGVGSEFWFELTCVAAPQRVVETTLPPDPTRPALPSGALHLLLYVEDNPANLLLVEQILEGHAKVRMLSARDANAGIALARAHRPKVILMDINLPGISGLEAMHILRKDPATADIPIIALSANAMFHDIEKGLKAGFFRYLTKPIRIPEFLITLDEALNLSTKKLARKT